MLPKSGHKKIFRSKRMTDRQPATISFSASALQAANANVEPLSDEVKQLLEYMMRFSFSTYTSTNPHIVGQVYHLYPYVQYYISKKPRDLITMRNILKFASFLINTSLHVRNRKREDLLVFEAVIVYAFMKSPYGEKVTLTMEEFESKYADICDEKLVTDEKNNLLDFCNCTRFVQQLIPPKNNKEHILDLVSRLTEGYSVRRVTGTGMTKETRNRYEIVRREGNLTPIERPGRRLDPNRPKPVKEPKKRGRPLSVRSEFASSALI